MNIQEESPKSKRRVRRSMENYKHPETDNYLLNNDNYYQSLNVFPRGSKFHKELAMRGMNLKKNNFYDSLEKSKLSGGIIEKYRSQTNSDKWVKNKKRNKSNEIVMVYQPTEKKVYPQIKSTLSTYKNSSLPESIQQTGRRKRSNSQWGSHNKRPKSSKNISGGRKYKAINQNSISTDAKINSINNSIEHTSIIANERPSSVLESLRYSKQTKKENKQFPKDINRETITSSIDVPSIELQNQDVSFQK